MSDINVSVEQQNDFSVHLHADSKLQQELEATKARAEQLDMALSRANSMVRKLSDELNNLKTERGIVELEEQLEEFRSAASRSLGEFKEFLRAVQLQDLAGYGDDWLRFQEWFDNISTGAQTASEAIAEVKSEYSELIRSSSRDSSGVVDSQMLRTFTSTLQSVASSIDEVRAKLTEFQENGIRAIPTVQGSDNTISGLEQVKNTIKEMADNANGAYEPLTKLIGVMTDYANIDNTNLFSVSQAIAGLGEIGKGSYSVKSVENTINLLTRLQTLTRAGAIHFNVTGLEAFSNLSVRKASLNNLATFLPTIASVDVANLERLSHVDLSNFNNLDIKKASMNNLVQMIEAVNNMRVDTSWSADLIQAVRDVSESVNNSKVDISWSNELMQLARNISNSIAQLNESMGHDRTIDLNIDKSSLQGLETILNDINNVIQHTDIPKVSGEMSEMGEVAQRVATYLGRYRDALNDAENTKVHNSLTDLGIAAKDADVISQHLSDMHIKVKSITPEWETITKIIDEEIIKEQKLKQITVQGTTALGDAVNHVIKFNAETGDISKEITRATVKGKELKQTIKELADGTKETNIETTVANLKEIDGLIKSIEKTNSSLNSSKNKVTDLLGGLSTTGKNREELDAINKKFDELTVATERLKTNRMTANQEDIDGLRKVQEELDALIRKSQERLRIESEANKKPKETKVVDFTVDGQKAEATLETIRRKLADLKEPSEEAKKSVSDLETAITAFNTATTQEDKQQALTNINKLITIANTRLSEQKIIQNKLEQANKRAETAERQAATSKEQALKRALALLKQIEQAESNWTAARKGKSKEEYSYLSTYATSLRQYVSDLESGKLTVKDFVAKMNQLSVSFQGTGSVIRANGEDVKSFGERVRELGSKFSAWFGVTRIIMRIYSTLRQMVSASIEVDNAMTQLQIVTKESDQVMSKFGDTAADAAKRIGSSVTDFLSSATTFARLGYSLNESSQLAEYTAMLQNVGNIDVAQAQDAITSIVKAYSDIDINQIESVMDKLVSTGNGFPISVGQIAEGMTNASAALSAAGNSFDQSVALLTAANAATQNAAKASTGLRTIAARIRKTKTELDDLGETMETADYDKIVQQLTHFNVSLTDVNGEYRSTYDIMADIAAKWNDMTSMEQAALAEALSGNRQQQIFYSIINNFKEASGAMDAMSSSAGTLKNAYSTYMESTTAHINQFKASFQDLSSNLFKSDLLKFFIDLGTRIVNAMNGLQKVHILLPTIVAIATAIRGIGLAKRLAESTAKINVLTAATIKEKTVTESLKNSVAALTIKERERFAADIQSAAASGKLSDEEAKQILTTLGLATADGTLTVANKSLAGSFKTLMASIPVWGWIALGVSVLADVIIWLSSSVSSTSDNIRSLEESFAQTQNEMRQISDEFKNLKESADETIPRFSDLAKGVDDFGKNISLTDEEYKEFLSLNNKIAEMFPQLNMGMDENGNYMLALSYSADTLRESLEQLLEVQRQEANEALAKKMPQNINDVLGVAKEYSNQIKDIKSDIEVIQSGVFVKSVDTGDLNVLSNIQAKAEYDDFVEYLRKNGIEVEEIIDSTPGGTVYTAKWDKTSDASTNLVIGSLKKIDDLESRITSKWKTINPSINAWLQSDYLYNDMNSQMQQVAQTMANALDFNALGLVTDNGEDTADNIQTYITKYIINPLYSSSDEVKTAFKDSMSLFESGEISETEFADRMKVAFDKLKQGMDDNEVTEFTNAFVKGFNAIGIAGDDFDSVADSLVENWQRISKAGGDADSLSDLSIQQYAEEIKKADEAISPLLDAYNKLQKGELSSVDVVKLISDKFPSLIKYTDNLSVGMQKLASAKLDEIKTKLEAIDQSKLSEEDLRAYDKFIEYIDNINDKFHSNLAYLEKIQTSSKNILDVITTLISLKNEINKYGSLSASSVEKIMSSDSLMLLRPYMNDVKSMIPIINNLIEDQKQAYEDLYNEQQRLSDTDAYIEASQQKQKEDESAFQNSLKRINDQVEKFKKKYGVDLSNWDKISDGKKEILKNTNAELLSKQLKLINDFSNYYNIDLKNFKDTTEAKAAILKNFRDSEALAQASQIAVEKGWLHNYQGQVLLDGAEAIKEISNVLQPLGLTVDDFTQYLTNGYFSATTDKRLTEQLNQILNTYTITPATWDEMLKDSGGSGSGSAASKRKTWFEQQYDDHNHLVKMEKETEKNYLDWLDNAYKQAYSQGIIDLDAYYKYEEEVYNGRKKLTGEGTYWFEKEYKEHQHRLKMETEDEESYLKWLDQAYKRAYSEGRMTLDDYRKYEEEVYTGMKKLFEKQYQLHQHYLKMETEDEADYLKWLNEAYKQAYKQGLLSLEDYRKYQEEVHEGVKKLKDNAESAIKSLVDIRINMIKEDVSKEKDSIDKRLKNIKDFYDKQKEMLQDKYDQEKYHEDQAEKRKKVSDTQAKIDQLRFDDSASAQKKRVELQKELVDAQKELDSFEKDHTFDQTKEQFDKLYEQQEKAAEKRKEELEKTVSSPQELYEQALNDIRNGSQSLYGQMIEWNNVYGDGIRDTIKKAWEEAYKAEKQYFNYTGAHFNGVNLSNATGYIKGVSGYASGTSHATAGIHKVDEKGIETIFQSADGQRYRMFSSGEKVLNTNASNFLYQFANKGREILDKLFNGTSHSYNSITPGIVANDIRMGDIVIQGNADKSTISEIRRAQRDSLEQMLKQLNRLK